MRILHTIGIAVGIACAAASASAAGTVSVAFVKPQGFTDVRDGFATSYEQVLASLKLQFEEAAAPYVGDGQTLKIEVLDVDLAGETRYGARQNNPRLLKGRADWPRIELRYVLETSGQAVRRGEARLQDMAYLNRRGGLPYDPQLAYERRMLNEWFRDEFKK